MIAKQVMITRADAKIIPTQKYTIIDLDRFFVRTRITNTECKLIENSQIIMNHKQIKQNYELRASALDDLEQGKINKLYCH